MKTVYESMIRLDLMIIFKIYQPLSQKLTDLTGRSCYWQASQAFLATIATSIIETVSWPSDKIIAVIILNFGWLLIAGYFYQYTIKAERKWQTLGEMTDSFVRFMLVRVFYLCLLLMAVIQTCINGDTHIYDVLYLIELACFLSGVYLLTCLPNHPRRRMVQKPVPLAS